MHVLYVSRGKPRGIVQSDHFSPPAESFDPSVDSDLPNWNYKIFGKATAKIVITSYNWK